MYLASNIKFLRKRKGLTQDDLARLIQIKRPTLNGYENNVAKPAIETLPVLSDFFRISIDNLIRINLENLSEFSLQQLEKGDDPFVRGSKIRVLSSTVDQKNIENIEMVPEKAKAGYTTGFADPEYLNDLPKYQLPFLSKNKKFRSFQITGDSMYPIPEGAWITGEFIQDWKLIRSNTLCIVLTLNDGIVFKSLENKIENDGGFLAHSLNPNYQDYFIPVVDIKEIWKFNHYISNGIPNTKESEDTVISTLQELKQEIINLKNQYKNKS